MTCNVLTASQGHTCAIIQTECVLHTWWILSYNTFKEPYEKSELCYKLTHTLVLTSSSKISLVWEALGLNIYLQLY